MPSLSNCSAGKLVCQAFAQPIQIVFVSTRNTPPAQNISPRGHNKNMNTAHKTENNDDEPEHVIVERASVYAVNFDF